MIYESEECVVCLECTPAAVFAPCRHRCVCAPCSELVGKSGQPCPLCRTPIADILVYQDKEAAGDVVQAVPIDEVRAFKEERRDEYVKKLRAPVTSDACFRGKSKLARSVASEVLSELEVRQRETAGTERVMAKKESFVLQIKDGQITIQYKVGRSKRSETHPYMTLEEARDGLLECLGGDRVSVLDVATHYPEFYWAIRLQAPSLGLTFETYLAKEMDVLSKSRKN